MPKLHTQLSAGIKAELPIALGVIPFGMIYGVLALSAGLPPLLAQAMSAIVFAGSAQFIGVQLISAATPAAVLLMTTFIVNLRHMFYSAAMAPELKHLSTGWRWLLSYLLTDEAYVVTAIHYNQQRESSAGRHFFLLGAGMTLWVFWQTSTAVGIFLGTQIPDSWSLDFTLALTFIGLVVPSLKNRANVATVFCAGIIAVLAFGLPLKLGLMIATTVGIITGVWVKSRPGITAAAGTGTGNQKV